MSEICVSGLTVKIVRKDIKNLHLGVYPPAGRIRVAVPLAVTDEAVRRAVIGKLGWIRRQQEQFLTQSRQGEREFVNGESHYFLGNRYRLRIVDHDGPGTVTISHSYLDLRVRPDSNAMVREGILSGWYRERLRELVPPLLAKWSERVGVVPAGWAIKRMKTKWGSCSQGARRIWLNLELAKKSVSCLEYLIVHELLHLLERRHNERFLALMDEHLPDWRSRRYELNAMPLAHEEWTY